MMIPLVDHEDVLRVLYERIDGLLLAGGRDIAPGFYGEVPIPEIGEVDVLRDEVELPLTRWAVADGKPVLGICRGVQLINVALGGTLYQDIPAQLGTNILHDDSYRREDWTYLAHDLEIDPHSRLAGLLGTCFPTNSLHHQSVKAVAPLGPRRRDRGVGRQQRPFHRWRAVPPRSIARPNRPALGGVVPRLC
jgi:putative glutamine amidotransferase